MNRQELELMVRENKFVRFIAKPFADIKRNLDLKKYAKSKDALFMKSLRNAYAGAGCFVIGNGPSLTPRDLDKIKESEIVSFGTNRIYHIYDKTKWRPTYYVSVDVAGLETEMNRIISGGDYVKFLNYKAMKFGRKPKDNIHYIYTFGNFKVNPYKMENASLSEDCSRHVSKTATVTANAIELAIYMGFSEIYLLGVDNNYARKRLTDGKVIRDFTVKSSYFEGMKDSQGNPGDGFSVQSVDYMNETYKICKQFAESHGVKILNATRGGKLDVFERVSLNEILRSASGRTL